MKNVLIAINSFKECADAVQVSNLFNKYLDKSLFRVVQKPISDGGDGFLEVCRFHFGLEILDYSISSPYDETYFDCKVGLDRKSKTLFIESAEVLGLKKIPKEKRHPLQLSSKGLGDLLQLIINDIKNSKFEVEKVIIGIGGTGTMDLGLGLCSRFGLKMFDSYGSEMEIIPENFPKVSKIEFNKKEIPFNLEVIIDVLNPVLGKDGGIIFGKQKGATSGELKVIELGWDKVIKSLYKNKILDASKELLGAGGGLAVGLYVLNNLLKKQASEFISNDLKIINKDLKVDMVITGEGSFDEQSLMGKGAGSIIALFEKENIPVVLCCGKINREISDQLSMNVFPIELQIFVDDPINSFEKAIRIACNEISGMTDILTKIS